MADLPPKPDSSGETGVEPDRRSPPSTPRWVKVLAIIAIVLVLLFVLLQFTGGDHGPRRHLPSDGELYGHISYSTVTKDHAPSGSDLGSHIPLSTAIEDYTLSGGDLAGHISPSYMTEHGVQQL